MAEVNFWLENSENCAYNFFYSMGLRWYIFLMYSKTSLKVMKVILDFGHSMFVAWESISLFLVFTVIIIIICIAGYLGIDYGMMKLCF